MSDSDADEDADKPTGSRRTHYAEDRTILANERTFAGWTRTSLACIALGLGFHAVFNRIDPPWVPRAIATSFLVLAVIIVVLAERRARTVMGRLESHKVTAAKRLNLRLFSVVISLGAIALAAVIWFLEFQ